MLTVKEALDISDRFEKRGEADKQLLAAYHAFSLFKQGNLLLTGDVDTLTKLATILYLDDVFYKELPEKTAAACLFENRLQGVKLLKELIK